MSAPTDSSGTDRSLPQRTVGPFTRMEFARYSIATDDPNRVHLEESVAAEAGFDHVIGSGGIVTSLAIDFVTSWAGLESLRTGSVKMLRPLVPGVTLTVNGSVSSTLDDGHLLVDVVLDDETGTRIGEAKFRVETDQTGVGGYS